MSNPSPPRITFSALRRFLHFSTAFRKCEVSLLQPGIGNGRSLPFIFLCPLIIILRLFTHDS